MHLLAITDLLSMLALGAALGFFGGLFGIGGGIIAIPFLALALGMEQAMAQGTSLAMMVPILLVAWWRYSRRHPISWRTAGQIGLLATPVFTGLFGQRQTVAQCLSLALAHRLSRSTLRAAENPPEGFHLAAETESFIGQGFKEIREPF